MRVRHFVAVTVATGATVAALLVAPGYGAPGLNVPVQITNKNCVVSYTVVSRQYSTFVFGVQNNGTVAHGFDISGRYKTGLIKPGQERTIVAHFAPGGYRWACVSAHSTVKRGTFLVR